MSGPDDVQRAARDIARLDTDQYLIRGAGKFYDALIADGWIPPEGPDRDRAIDDAYTSGQNSVRGRTVLTTSPDAWLPVELRWRHVRKGDVFVVQGRVWLVLACGQDEPGWLTDVTNGADQYEGVEVDPDEMIHVLCPAPEADALAGLRSKLGGKVVDRTV